jgi:uncharacterized damage-inducible protein DinB
VTETEREVLSLEPIADEPEVGRWLSAMEDCRRDTLRELEGLPADALDRWVGTEQNSIGSLLYHVALVEADWLLSDIMGPEGGVDWPAEILPAEDRDAEGLLTRFQGDSLEQHLERLRTVRALVMEHLQPMSLEEFHRPRSRERYDVSPAWVLHHLLQHEAEHRSEIVRLRQAASAPA